MSLQARPGFALDLVAARKRASGAAPIRKGDICRVEAMPGWETEPRIAVVMRTHSGPVDYAEILLAHPCVEMAGPNDAILDPDDTGLPHQLVVQPFVRGSVWQMQLTQLLSRVPQHLMKAIGQLYRPEGPPPEVRTGSPGPDSSDARRRFKDSERESLQTLYGDLVDAMLDDGAPWQLDPDLASPSMVLRSDNSELVVTELAHMLRTRPVAATAEYLRLMEESDTLDVAAWREATRDRDLASEMVRRLGSLMESAPHVYGAFTPDGPAEAPPLRMPPRIPGSRDLTLYAERRLITAPFLWADSDQLLKQADEAQDDQCFEVFMLAKSVELAR